MSHDTHVDHRLAPRWAAQSTVSVFRHDTKEYIGLLVDCSETGIMLSSYEHIAPGTELDLDLVDVPANINTRRTGTCHAKVVWCDKLTPSLFANGCQISNADTMLSTMFHSYEHHHRHTSD